MLSIFVAYLFWERVRLLINFLFTLFSRKKRKETKGEDRLPQRLLVPGRIGQRGWIEGRRRGPDFLVRQKFIFWDGD